MCVWSKWSYQVHEDPDQQTDYMRPDTGVPGEMFLVVLVDLRVVIMEARDIIQDVPSSPPENNDERREDDTRPDKTNQDTAGDQKQI